MMSSPDSASQTVRPRGPTLHDIIRTYDDQRWEKFVTTWAEIKKEAEGYKVIHNISGAGDHGVDVAAYLGEPSESAVPWDAYQCKHYGGPLLPSQVWAELGKLCYYTWNRTYSMPRRYRFAAPRDVSQKLNRLILRPDELKKELIANWDKHCRRGITTQHEVPLEGMLLAHVESLDLSRVGWVPANQLINEYANSPQFYAEFELPLPDRPPAPIPPEKPTSEEQRYVEQLFSVYSEAEGTTVDRNSLKDFPTHQRHFRNSREHFYTAEGLRRFTREYLPDAFESFKKDILVGVEDVCASSHSSAMNRLTATTERAVVVQLGAMASKIGPGPADRKGTCHHLANEDQLTWNL